MPDDRCHYCPDCRAHIDRPCEGPDFCAINTWGATVRTRDLLEQIAKAENELLRRGVIRSGRLAGDYAEWLVQQTLGGKLAQSQAERGYDLELPDGKRVQVKGRRETAGRPPTHWDFTRLDFQEFVGVVFDHDFHVVAAYRADVKAVEDLGRAGGRKHRLRRRDLEPDAHLTAALRRAQGLEGTE